MAADTFELPEELPVEQRTLTAEDLRFDGSAVIDGLDGLDETEIADLSEPPKVYRGPIRRRLAAAIDWAGDHGTVVSWGFATGITMVGMYVSPSFSHDAIGEAFRTGVNYVGHLGKVALENVYVDWPHRP